MPKRIFLVFVLILTLTALPAWGVDLNPGKYEITTRVKMPGMPGEMPPQTVTQCLSKQDLVPGGTAGAQGCKITDMKTEGNSVIYKMECRQDGMTIKSDGKITYNGDTFEGTTQTHMGPSGGNMTITTIISGKRIGKCE